MPTPAAMRTYLPYFLTFSPMVLFEFVGLVMTVVDVTSDCEVSSAELGFARYCDDTNPSVPL